MAKPEQVLTIDPPQELRFLGPYNVMTSANLKLTNNTNNHVLFKIKTTVPKKYCVRPNSGIVEPKKSIQVQVFLQPFVYDSNEKNKHKFMVQTLLWNPKGDVSQEAMWKDAKPENLMDTKLKCVFESEPLNLGSAAKSSTQTVSPVADSDNSTRFVSGDSLNHDNELLAEARRELQGITDEKYQLEDENIALKEELRLVRNKAEMIASEFPTWSQPSFQTPVIVLAILAGLIGIVLGKFLL